MIKKIDSKRFIKYLMSFIICMPLLFITAYASEIDTNFDIDSQIEASGVNELYNDLPEETAEYLKSTGLDSVNYKNFTELNAGKFIYSIIGITENEMKSPLIVAGLILGMLIFASLIKSGEHTLNSPLSSSFSNVMSAAIATVLVVPIVGLINDVSTVVSAACTFTEAFAPIFIGILLANGQTVLSAGYSSFLFGAIELTTICMDELLIPVLKIFLAISCVCAVSPCVKIDGFMSFIEKNAKWLLSFLAVTLSGILGISGIISASADNVASRTAKFIISGSVPIVGGAVSDAYLSIKGGISLLRNSVGAFGIIVVVYIFLPIIIRTLLWNVVVEIGLMTCEVLQLNTTNKLLKSVSSMLSLMLGILIFSLFVLILAGTVVIMQKNA